MPELVINSCGKTNSVTAPLTSIKPRMKSMMEAIFPEVLPSIVYIFDLGLFKCLVLKLDLVN